MCKDCVNVEAKHRIYIVYVLKPSIRHIFSRDRCQVATSCVVQRGVPEIKLNFNSLIV